MKMLLLVVVAAAVVAAPVLVLAFAPAPDAGSRTVEYKTLAGYAESRDSGMKGDASFVALTSKTEFSRVFDPVFTPRGVPDPVAKDAFDTRLFVAVIKRSDVLWEYKVEKVTANGDTLTVAYRATPRQGGDIRRGATYRAGPKTTLKDEPEGATIRVRSTARARDTEKAPVDTKKADPPRGETVKARPKGTYRDGGATEKGYATTEKADGSSERARRSSDVFDSPLILSVPKDKYLTVVFIENGKKVGTARVGN
jgi:hypothetical protein